MVPLLQIYSNPSSNRLSPQELLLRSRRSARVTPHTTTPGRSVRQLREREKRAVVARYLEIRNMRQLAREFSISRTTVARVLAEHGIDTSRGMSPADVRQAAELYEQGASSMTIGKAMGFDNHTILSALRSAEVVIRQQIGR
jgi:hypothetical protein